jgi:hypothetical protein
MAHASHIETEDENIAPQLNGPARSGTADILASLNRSDNERTRQQKKKFSMAFKNYKSTIRSDLDNNIYFFERPIDTIEEWMFETIIGTFRNQFDPRHEWQRIDEGEMVLLCCTQSKPLKQPEVSASSYQLLKK